MIIEDKKYEQLKDHADRLLKCDIYKNRKIEACPSCSEKTCIKYGKYKGIQRYRCKKCSKTFSNVTYSLLSYSKKDPEKWIKFMELMFQRKTLRECADILKINLRTAFIWRHKIMDCMKDDIMSDKLEGKVFLSKAIIKENFKGCRKAQGNNRKNI